MYKYAVGILLSLSATTRGFAGTSTAVTLSSPVPAWSGEAWASSTLDKHGFVDSLTLSISMAAIRSVPAGKMESVIIDLPAIVTDQTFFDHISFDWVPHGHVPQGIYDRPHFDVHFYHSTVAEVAAVDCTKTTKIASNLLAPAYALPPADDPEYCVPHMGVHASPASDFAPHFEFRETFIYGYYEKDLAFFEPMITKEFFLSKQAAEHQLQLPASFLQLGKSLPQSYSIRYLEENDEYQITFRDFVGGGRRILR